MTELAEAPVPAREWPVYWSEDTVAAQIEKELASAAVEDARSRWLQLEVEVRRFDDEHRGDGLSDDPMMMGQRARLRRLYSEAEVAKMRAGERLRTAGARWYELQQRDYNAHRASEMAEMYAQRDAEDRARMESLRRRRSLFGRLRR